MANEADLLEVESPAVETPEAPEAPETLRDTLTKAFDEVEDATPETPKQPSEPAAKPAAEGQAPTAPERGAKDKPVASPPEKGSTTGELKAPAQWKPNIKEKWNAIPREVQEEILRREGDSMRLIGSVGPKIRLADEVAGHIQPFMEQLSQNNVSPSSFMNDVFASIRTLSNGNPMQRAETVANIVQSYGVDLRMLDHVLTHRLQVGPEAFEARRQAARAQAQVQQYEGHFEQQSAEEAQRALTAFASDPKHEFLDEVRDLMADLIEADRATNLEDAYAAAVWAHPDTRKILLERQAQERVQSKSARAQAARRASSAVHGGPTNGAVGAAANPNASLRDTLEAAFDEHTNL
jgi:hypothetical protein